MTAADAIYVARWGIRGPGVVLLHGGVQGGLAAGERHFADQKPLADEGWQLFVPDRPGHGRSANPGRGDDAEIDGLWAAALLGDGAHLVGHSFGGMVALRAAALRPAAVRSLTLIEPAAFQIATRSPAVRRLLLQMIWTRLSRFSAASRARRLMQLLGIPPMPTAPNAAQLARQDAGIRRMRQPSKAAVERDLDAVKRAGIPLLTISGGWSKAFDDTCMIAAARGGGRHVISASPHHFTQWNGKSFNDLLSGFWHDSALKKRRRPDCPAQLNLSELPRLRCCSAPFRKRMVNEQKFFGSFFQKRTAFVRRKSKI